LYFVRNVNLLEIDSKTQYFYLKIDKSYKYVYFKYKNGIVFGRLVFVFKAQKNSHKIMAIYAE